MNIVYALYCPERKIPKYVGKSTVGLDRPISHIKNASHNMAINNWIRELGLKGLTPMIIVLENDIKKELLNDREKFWIKDFFEKKFNLLNGNNRNKAINYKKSVSIKKINIKINIGLKLEETTITVVKALLHKPENLKLKDKFNAMIDYLIETHPEYIEMKKELDKKS